MIMSGPAWTRLTVITVLVIVGLLIVVPREHWAMTFLVIKVTALCGTSGVMLYRCIRRH